MSLNTQSRRRHAQERGETGSSAVGAQNFEPGPQAVRPFPGRLQFKKMLIGLQGFSWRSLLFVERAQM